MKVDYQMNEWRFFVHYLVSIGFVIVLNFEGILASLVVCSDGVIFICFAGVEEKVSLYMLALLISDCY